MLRSRWTVLLLASFLALLTIIPGGSSSADDAPKVVQLVTQRVGDVTYFQVRLAAPGDMPEELRVSWDNELTPEAKRRAMARLPRLLPQDDKTRAVYHLLASSPGRVTFPKLTANGQLQFLGQLQGEGAARFLLIYPGRKVGVHEVAVTLDFTTAKPADGTARLLQERWAVAQADHFGMLEAQALEFGFPTFAREATARKYRVKAFTWKEGPPIVRGQEHRQLYDLTTGASAITESLAMQRMLNPNLRDRGARIVPIAKVRGIDIPEHPWQKMMAGKKPLPEPLARLVPHDNFYVHFKSVRKFIEFGELMDQWGTDIVRSYELTSRDYQIRQRYEKQLCLRSTALGKTLGPALIRSLAVTGSDGYVREGTDLTIIFHVANQKAFLAAANLFVEEARKEFGNELKEGKSDYRGVAVESFVTPLREVSLHRAVIDEHVIYSNSPAGLRRVIDTQQKKHRALADSLDFQYMRTIFRLEDKEEDGFVFLSDAFIRQLVGPASKIKEKRRLEALTSMHMVTNGALFTAWETGKLPADHQALLVASGLKPHEIEVPEGKGVFWDPKRQVAVSDVYNTFHFATPLVELPIDRVTTTEAAQYGEFRDEYLRLWRRYFDPVGIRIGLNEQQVRVETYILPLIQSSQYNDLRQFTGGGTTTLDTATLSSAALAQFLVHLSPDARGLVTLLTGADKQALGDWFFIRVDDDPIYAKLGELWIRQELAWNDLQAEAERLFFQLPLTVGLRIGNQRDFDKLLTALKDLYKPDIEERARPAYKEVAIHQIEWKADTLWVKDLNKNLKPEEKPFQPSVFSAQLDGAWYLSLREESLKKVIDEVIAQRDGKAPAKVEVNGSLYLAPAAANLAGPFLRSYLEWETHRRALANGPLWHTLHRCGLVAEDAQEKSKQAAAMRYLGFIPVSPDGAAYSYEARTDEVLNRRHGSLGRPKLHASIDETSSLGQLLQQLRTLRADLRFREDGVHTTLTIERKAPEK